jgi:hypothetical protein
MSPSSRAVVPPHVVTSFSFKVDGFAARLTPAQTPMAAMRKLLSISSLTLVAIGISAAALAVLFTFPKNALTWQAASWALVAGLVVLLLLAFASGYVLATDQAARTWQRITLFLIGLACLAAVAVGSL